MDQALLGSVWTGSLGLLTLMISRIRCLYKRDEHGCHPICACTEKGIQPDDDIEIHEVTVGDRHAVILLPSR